MGPCGLKGALGTIREEVVPAGEGDSTQLGVAVAADPSLPRPGCCPPQVPPAAGATGPPGPPSAVPPPSPAMLLRAPAQRGCQTALCRILNVPR